MADSSTTPEQQDSGRKLSGLMVAGYVVVAILIIVGLFLPPISLGQRLGLTGNAEETDTPAVEAPAEEAMAEEEASAEAMTDLSGEISLGGAAASTATVTLLPEGDAATLHSSLPSSVTPVGNSYSVAYDGAAPTGSVAVALTADAGAPSMVDMYGWDGSAWRFMPSEVDLANQRVIAVDGAVPQAVTLVQTAAPEMLAVSAELNGGEALPEAVASALTELSGSTLTLVTNDDGAVALDGDATAVSGVAADQMLRVTNVGDIADQASLSALLSDAAAQEAQIGELVSAAASNGFAGVNVDYQRVAASQREAFTSFVQNFDNALAAEGLALAVTLGTPMQVDGDWDTVGHNWAALGEAADVVYAQMPLDPTSFADGGEAEQLLNWATRHVDRYKMTMLTTANAVDKLGESYTELSNAEALASFGDIQFVEGEETVAPETAVSVALSGDASPLEWDGSSRTYTYSYSDNDQMRTVWLGNEASVSYRARLANRYQLRGVALRGLGNAEDGTRYAEAINTFTTAGAPIDAAGAAIVWTVRDANDGILASASGSDLTFSWDGTADEGAYSINADFAFGDNVVSLGGLDLAVGEVAEEVVEEEAAEEVAEEEAPAEETAAEEDGGATIATPAEGANAVVAVNANVRQGPGLIYGTLAGGITAGNSVTVIGRSEDSLWLNVELPDGQEGWIFASLLDVDGSVDIAALPIPAVTATPSGGGGTTASTGGDDGDGGGGAAAPPPVAAPPVANAGFELGGQTHSFANPQLMSYAGMNWVKFQHKWGPGNNPQDLAGRINQAHANGFKVLLSIPGSPYPESIDYASYVDFLGGVAALGPDAIEIWNEVNIDFEWPVGQISGANYVNNMLAPAYNKIKSVNPNVMVVGGAPAPTGAFGGGCTANGCDDSAYIAQMVGAGAGSYMDCMGVHYNAGATAPSQSTGHPAGNDHYSWHLQPMINLYAQLGKPLCFTELGYLSGQDFGGVPPRFSWAGGTSVQQHASWLAEAVSIAANSGRVRMVIVFNVDFTLWGDDPQAGYAIIRADGGCPACETLRAVMNR